MPRLRRANKIPKEWVWCPVCGQMYGFVRARVSLGNPQRERCLVCAEKERNPQVMHL